MKKIFLIGIIIMAFILPMSKVEAKTLDDLNKELANRKSQKQEQESKKKLTEAEIKQVKTNISNTNAAIEQIKKDIITAQDNIEKSKVKIQEKKLETEELLKFLQLSSGENVYLEYLFAAEDYTDFIYRYAIVSQLSEYNNNLMDDLDKLIKELEDEKVTLANKQKENETKTTELNNQLKKLGNQLSAVIEDALSIDDEIKSIQDTIKVYKDMGCKSNEDIEDCINRIAKENGGVKPIPYATGFRVPVAKGIVTSNFGWRYGVLGSSDFHSGIDFSGWGEGTSVMAAADGKVGAIIWRSSCGGNQIYVHHNVKGVQYTTSYLHLLSIKVNVGDVVTQGQVIATSGGGASTASYDSCSTGSHLHFGIGKGWYLGTGYTGYSTWVSNLIDPREIWPQLPAAGSGVWFYR